MGNQPRVLIVILNYGTYDLTINLISEIRNKIDYCNYSIMVVDNCSPNESEAILSGKSHELNYIFYANKTNAGYAAGNNIGVRYGIENGYDYSWVLNNDVELQEKNVLGHMIEIAEKDKHIGCIGPRIVSNEGVACAPYCRRPSFWSMTGGIGIEKRYRQNFINKSREVYRVYGCCMLLRNSAMAEVDCMDERTFLYGEEDILAERLLAKGYISYYDADVSVIHKGSSSVKKMSKNSKQLQIRETEKSLDIYLKEYRHFPWIARWGCKSVRRFIIKIR